MTKRQRVWIVSELYWPELTSTGFFLTGISEGLAEDYNVSVLCGQPSYWARGVRAPAHESLKGVDVWRCWATTFDKDKVPGKLMNLITISLSVLCMSLLHFRRGDIAIVVTNPPLLPYVTALSCRLRRARFVLLVHDVYPEVFTRLGLFRPGSIVIRTLHRLSRNLYNRADRIVVLGRDMRKLATEKLRSRKERVIIAPNWGDTDLIRPQPPSRNRLLAKLGLSDEFVAQYCGNIGRTHGIEDLISTAALLRDHSEFHFLLIGWGARKHWAAQQCKELGLRNLTILNPLPRPELQDGLNACNLAMVSFASGMTGISVPSRMYNVLAAGKPLLAVCDSDSELAMVVNEEDVGWVIPPGRPDLIVAALQEARKDPDRLRRMGGRARQAAEARYTRHHVIQKYRSLIEELKCP